MALCKPRADLKEIRGFEFGDRVANGEETCKTELDKQLKHQVDYLLGRKSMGFLSASGPKMSTCGQP